jgi:hypothetical protein
MTIICFKKNNKNNNKLYCHVMQEDEIYDMWKSKIPYINEYDDGKASTQTDIDVFIARRHAKEKFFRQIYSLQHCNDIIKQSQVNYKYKMRIRPDLAMYPSDGKLTIDIESKHSKSNFLHFHKFKDMNGIKNGSPCNSTIIITDYLSYIGGNQDTFAYGLSKDMDYRFNLYNAIVYEGLLEQRHNYANAHKNINNQIAANEFNPESILEYYLYTKGICLISDPNVKGAVIRLAKHSFYEELTNIATTDYKKNNNSHTTTNTINPRLSAIKPDIFHKWFEVIKPENTPFKENQLIKFAKDAREIMIYTNDTFRPIADWDTFLKYKFDLNNIIIVDLFWKDIITLGPVYT